MATTIIRYSNRYRFEVRGLHVDVNSDEVEVLDYAHVEPNNLYYVGSSELGIKKIGSKDYLEYLLGTDYYRVNNSDMEELMQTGHCKAHHRHNTADVYVGLHFAPILKKYGEDSLAKCYAYIAQKRKEHADNLDQAQKLLAVGANATATEDTAENLVEDIKWFLDNRKQIKAMCK